jgi:hypothetical protein
MSAAHSAQPRSGPLVALKPRLGRRMARFNLALVADWVKNALAHGAVRLTANRHEHELAEPEVVADPQRQHVPLPWHWFLAALRVSQFIDFERAGPGSR